MVSTLVGPVLAATLATLLSLWPSIATRQDPQFRSSVTLVPVDVYVTGKNGEPVTDLQADDFTLAEDGVTQPISHCELIDTAKPNAPGRSFFVVLGRGDLNAPSKAIEALEQFVGSLAPADQVGIEAYLRIVPMTTDHESVLRFLREYRSRHPALESRLVRDAASAFVDAPPTISRGTRSAIDELFSGADVSAIAAPAADGDAESRYNDFRYLGDALSYLTLQSGNKHVIVVTERGFRSQAHDRPQDDYWFQRAASAKSALVFIQTGGLLGTSAPASAGRGPNPLSSMLGTLNTWDLASQRSVASETGGSSSFFEYATRPLETLNRVTRAHYVLGYYPKRDLGPQELRLLEVTVRRSEVSLTYQHGYQAKPSPDGTVDFREAVTVARIQEAQEYFEHPMPVGSNLDSGNPSGTRWQMRLAAHGDGHRYSVEVSFDPSRATFLLKDGLRTADMTLVVTAVDPSGATVGSVREPLAIRLSSADFSRTRQEWLKHSVVLQTSSRPDLLRAVLYDYSSDRTAAAQVRLK